MSPDLTKHEESTPAVAHGMAHHVANWLLTGRSEPASKFMAGVALNGSGYRSPWNDPTPHDASDLGRCVQLLQAVPEVRPAAFAILKNISPVWEVYIAHWAELESLWKVGDHVATTARLRELRRSVVSGQSSVAETYASPTTDHGQRTKDSTSELTRQLL